MGKIKLACAQIHTELGQEERNLAKILAAIDEAATAGAHLVIFPEGANTGYCFDDRNQSHKLATPVPGPFTDALSAKAREKGIYLGIGIFEQGPGNAVYNESLLIDPQGRIVGKYQKNFLIVGDKHWFKPGEQGYPVFDTALGKVGFFICADGRIPESARCLALAGAQILLNTSCWGSPDQYQQHVPARAVENRCFVAAVTKPRTICGRLDKEVDYNPFTGCSFIMDLSGQLLARASETEEEIIYAQIEPERAIDKRLTPENDLFADRRPEAYRILTEPYSALPASRVMAEAVIPDSCTVQLACLQVSGEQGAEQALGSALALAFEAVTKYDANLIVLPELFLFEPDKITEEITGCVSVSEKARDELTRFAQEKSLFIVANLVEEEGGKFFSTAYLLGPTGVCGKYRKVHLWGSERKWAHAGDDFPVFSTPYGYLGMMLGYDGMFPEAARALTLSGADIILWPTNWHTAIEPELLAKERAVENQVVVAAANRPDSPFAGPSLVIQPLPTATLCNQYTYRRPGYLTRLVNLSASRVKRIYYNTDIIRHRRPELYSPLVATPKE